MRRLALTLPILALAACETAPETGGPPPDRIAFTARGHDGAATGQTWAFAVTSDDRFTCQQTSPMPLTGEILPPIGGRIPGLYQDVAAIVGQQVVPGEWSIVTGEGTITEAGETAQIDPDVFYDATTGGALSRLIIGATEPFGYCLLWG